MITYKFYLPFLLLTAFGCQQNSDNQQTSNPKQPTDAINRVENPSIKAVPQNQTTRLIITYYDKYIPPNKDHLNYGPFSTDIIYETKDQKVLDAFEQMTKLGEKTGYCCCADYNYTISFYDKTYNYQDFYVDTVEFKDKVRIFQSSYQFSYIVDKAKWHEFLLKLKKISFNEYFISDLNAARKVYAFTLDNNLPIITSNRVSKEWANFDGDFKVRVAVVGENLNEDSVYKKIKDTYPHDTFKIETISSYHRSGSHDGHDRYEEIILQIYCNKNFYDRFEIYGPKSFFDEAVAEFYVLGTRKDLNKIDRIAKKEK